MKFLVDNCISWIVRDQLRGQGYDVVHVRDYGLQEAEDIDIFGGHHKKDELSYQQILILVLS